MKNQIERVCSSFLFRYFILGVLVTAGVAGGLYIGSAFIAPSVIPIAGPDQRPEPTKSMKFVFGPGDLFPLENCTTVSGDTVNFEQILMGRRTLLAFVSAGCSPCEKFFNFFVGIEPELLGGVQMVVCFADNNVDIPTSYSEFLENKIVLFVDTHHFLD